MMAEQSVNVDLILLRQNKVFKFLPRLKRSRVFNPFCLVGLVIKSKYLSFIILCL